MKTVRPTLIYDFIDERENNIIGKRITEARKESKLSLVKLSMELAKCGIEIGAKAINKWELGKSVPTAYQLLALCHILSIGDGLSYFYSKSPLNTEGQKKLAEYKELLISSGKFKFHMSRCDKLIEMPVSYLPVSAGTGAFLDEGDFEMVSFPESAVPSKAEFGIRVSGDSMEPVYHDGQIVWVEQCNSLRVGEVGIFVYDGNGYIKVYDEQQPENEEEFTDSYGELHMQPVMVSYNKKYANRMVSPNIRFEIVGRVLQ